MEKVFHVEIVTPAGLAYSKDIVSLIVPAQMGYLGVLANHAPLLCNLRKGKITLIDSSRKSVDLETKGSGFIEVLKNKVTILLESPISPLA
ncbi:MAG: hypothetical protein NT033_09080 [Candidatus Omnitrophica bacterium]|nr:hypothetical protein [Candidatus Omnitrophota bacterium]